MLSGSGPPRPGVERVDRGELEVEDVEIEEALDLLASWAATPEHEPAPPGREVPRT